MDVMEAIEGRRSIRRFATDDVPDEHIVEIMRAAGLAPSGGNQQMWHFLVIKNREKIERMREAVLAASDEMRTWLEAGEYASQLEALRGYGTFFAGAPVVIAVLTNGYNTPLDAGLLPKHGLSFEEIYRLRGDPARQSVGAAIQNLLLRAYSLGYGTCWMTGPLFANPAIRRILGIEAGWDLVAIVPLGVPAETPQPRPRRPVEEIFTIVE